MREINALELKSAIIKLLEEAAYDLPPETIEVLSESLEKETSPIAKEILGELLENAEIAKDKKLPICQDTGMATIFLEIGQEVLIKGDSLKNIINEAVITSYKDLRKSIVSDPINRENTKDNTPANIHIEIVPKDKIKIQVLPKGGGAENASFLKMFLPTASKKEITAFIVEQIKQNGPKACPPIILGVGIGGSFDSVAILAKKALLRPIKNHSTNYETKKLEEELLDEINKTGIGPMGIGGNITVLAVHIETAPCHIASLPVAVNFQCHAHRYKEITL